MYVCFHSNSTVCSFDILSGKSLWSVKTKVLEFYHGVHSKGRFGIKFQITSQLNPVSQLMIHFDQRLSMQYVEE